MGGRTDGQAGRVVGGQTGGQTKVAVQISVWKAAFGIAAAL